MKSAHCYFNYSVIVFLLGLALSGCGSGSSSNTSKPQAGFAPAILSVNIGNVFDFGNQIIGTTAEQSFTISNIGDKTATDISGSFYFSINFAYKDGSFPGTGGTCGHTLIPGASCTVVVTFSPQTLGQAETVLAIDYNDGTAPKTTTAPTLQGRGI